MAKKYKAMFGKSKKNDIMKGIIVFFSIVLILSVSSVTMDFEERINKLYENPELNLIYLKEEQIMLESNSLIWDEFDYEKGKNLPRIILKNFNDSHLSVAQKVIDGSNKVILGKLENKEFDEIYKTYVEMFHKRYSTYYDDFYVHDYIQSVQELKVNHFVGDCDDYALFFYVVAKKKGLEARYKIGFSNKETNDGHAWVQIKIDGKWVDYNSTSNLICDDCISNEYKYRGGYIE